MACVRLLTLTDSTQKGVFVLKYRQNPSNDSISEAGRQAFAHEPDLIHNMLRNMPVLCVVSG